MSEKVLLKIDKNLEIRNRLLDRIESGEWKTGDKLVFISKKSMRLQRYN